MHNRINCFRRANLPLFLADRMDLLAQHFAFGEDRFRASFPLLRPDVRAK